jgi:uncharacterized protein YjbI with pentapeptide repeats
VDSSNTVIVSVMVEEKGRQTADKKESRKPWTLREFGGQMVWDWLHLLSALAIPVVLALAGLYFEAQLDERQRSIENQRAEAERELAEQRAQDEALQAYLNQMSQLMLERKLLEAEEGDPVHTLAQARTSTVILRLDAEHNQSVTGFLIDSGLAESSEASPRLLRGIALPHAKLSGAPLHFTDLSDAILVNADLSNASLVQADLSDAYLVNAYLVNADLTNADLSTASLDGADLSGAALNVADLSDAGLRGADLSGADLNTANLSDAILNHADLSDAILDFADLSGAHLFNADLSGAHLFNADLSDADLGNAHLDGVEGITNEELEQRASSLEDATMPNGQKYEDWLKSQGRAEDAENA